MPTAEQRPLPARRPLAPRLLVAAAGLPTSQLLFIDGGGDGHGPGSQDTDAERTAIDKIIASADLTHLTPAPHGSGNCPGAGDMAGLLDMHRAALERELAVTGGTVAT